jgi:hypothetical protein
MFACESCYACNWCICSACYTNNCVEQYSGSGSGSGSSSGVSSKAMSGWEVALKPVEARFKIVQMLNKTLISALPLVDLCSVDKVGSVGSLLAACRGTVLLLSPSLSPYLMVMATHTHTYSHTPFPFSVPF